MDYIGVRKIRFGRDMAKMRRQSLPPRTPFGMRPFCLKLQSASPGSYGVQKFLPLERSGKNGSQGPPPKDRHQDEIVLFKTVSAPSGIYWSPEKLVLEGHGKNASPEPSSKGPLSDETILLKAAIGFTLIIWRSGKICFGVDRAKRCPKSLPLRIP